jgi:hypothetical protein
MRKIASVCAGLRAEAILPLGFKGSPGLGSAFLLVVIPSFLLTIVVLSNIVGE